MCGHGIIAVTKIAIETGLITTRKPETIVRIDTPAGRVTASAILKDGRVSRVVFENVPSFVLAKDLTVTVEKFGSVKYDIAFGGAFYAFVRADDLSLICTTDHISQLIEAGMAIKNAVIKNHPINHPFEKELGYLYGTIFIAPPHDKKNHSRNVCIFAEGEVDRSPTGTGVSARLALHFERQQIGLKQQIVIESILGTTFTCSVARTQKYGPYNAVIPLVEGTAYITGKHEFLLDPQDDLRHGFLLR